MDWRFCMLVQQCWQEEAWVRFRNHITSPYSIIRNACSSSTNKLWIDGSFVSLFSPHNSVEQTAFWRLALITLKRSMNPLETFQSKLFTDSGRDLFKLLSSFAHTWIFVREVVRIVRNSVFSRNSFSILFMAYLTRSYFAFVKVYLSKSTFLKSVIARTCPVCEDIEACAFTKRFSASPWNREINRLIFSLEFRRQFITNWKEELWLVSWAIGV